MFPFLVFIKSVNSAYWVVWPIPEPTIESIMIVGTYRKSDAMMVGSFNHLQDDTNT